MTSMIYITINVFQMLLGLTNYNNLGGQLILDGVLNNQIVVSTNNFKMPVYDENVQSNYIPKDNFHIMNPKHQNFPFLGDWIIIPKPGRYATVSIGDIEIFMGTSIILWNYFKK